MSTLLDVRDVSRRFGGIVAVDRLSFDVRDGEKLAVIGPNGAGKSTILKIIAGEDKPTGGEVELRDAGIVSRRSRLARHGIALARQVPRPLRSISVRDNVRVGLAAGADRRTLGAEARLDQILEQTGLATKERRLAGQLALLDLKRLEVARALATEPRLLLLDEVSAGLNERDLDAAIELLTDIHAQGTALLIVEHVQRVVHELADRVIVLDWGRKIAEGSPSEVAADSEVNRVYLGIHDREAATAEQHLRVQAPAPDAGLRLDAVRAAHGSVTALDGVSLAIGPGEIVAVLGANGAGKSSLAQTVSGLLPVRSGRVFWEGDDITALPPHLRARRGIAHCQEGRRLFRGLTVAENLEIAAGRTPRDVRDQRRETVLEIFPDLRDRLNQVATTMSGGQQQMVAIGRALMADPKLILCDEVTLGLSPKVADEIYRALREVAASGTSLLLVEQSVERCLSAASHVYVLARGTVVYDGSPRELEPRLLSAAYLGG